MGLGPAAVGLLIPIALELVACGEEESVSILDGPGGVPDGRTFLSSSVVEGGVSRPLVEGTRIRLEFADGDLSAYAGCNYLELGNARQEGGRLVADQTSFTEMGCGREREAQDDWLADFLTSEPTVRLDGDSLRLTSEHTTIELVPRQATLGG
jgi:heat shock protein HslJ